MKQIKYSIILLFTVNLISSVVTADELPDLGSRSKTIISREKEKILGKEFIKAIRREAIILNDHIVNQYIQEIGNKLVAHSNIKNKKFHFFIIVDPSINAFTGPDAHIGINSGTIAAMSSDSELAAIIAHEVAHVSQYHIPRLIETARNTQIITLAGVLASMLVGGNIANSGTIAAMGGSIQQMISSIRSHEFEADSMGLKILKNSGFDPNAMSRVFTKMQKLNFNYSNEIPSFLRTHSIAGDRIAEVKNRIKSNDNKVANSRFLFNLIQARIKVLTSNDLFKTIRIFENQLKKSDQKNNPYLRYSYAFALFKNLQTKQASQVINTLLKEYPNEILFQMLESQIAINNKAYDISLKILNRSITLNPNYYPLVIQYIQTLNATKKYQIVEDFIEKNIKKDPDNAELYFLLAQAYARNNKITDAYLAKAKAYELTGYNRQAAILLHQALKKPKLSTTNKAIINARIKHLKNIIKKS